MNEFENVPYVRLKGIRIFFNNIIYRAPHFHKSLELMMVLSGEMLINAEHSSLHLAEKDIAVINAGVPHELSAINSNCTFLCLQFAPDSYWSGFPPIHFKSNLPRDFLGEEEYSQLVDKLLKMARVYFNQDPFFEVYCISVVHSIVYTMLSSIPIAYISSDSRDNLMKTSDRVIRLVDFVDKNYTRKIKLADFAASEGKSLSYISHFVKNAMNQSFQTYVNTVRFYAACRLMSAGTMGMLDICYEVGFSDYRYFSKVFKERTGLTPSQYQKAHEGLNPLSSDGTNEHIFTDDESVDLLSKLGY